MKKLFLLYFLLMFTLCGQDAKDVETKMDMFASKTGVIIKFIDHSLPDLPLLYGSAETRIRKLISGGEEEYFYQISKEGQYDTKTASIAYEDLLEVIKALQTLKIEAENDKAMNPDYLENKFITDDGFQVGYYVSRGKVTWYLKLEKYGSGSSVFIKDASTLTTAFHRAKDQIELEKL